MKSFRAFLVLSFIGLVSATAPAAADSGAPAFTFPRGTPESEGVDSAAVLKFVNDAETKQLGLDSVMLVRRGKVVAEGWWAPVRPHDPHLLHSLTKSFTSTAIGLAVAEGKLSVEDPVLKFFPEDAPANPSAWLQGMKVKHLLTMSTGHVKEDIDAFPYRAPLFGRAKNLPREFFAMKIVDEPGTKFIYDSAGSHMLSEIISKVTGQSILEYLRPRLFDPLGIAPANWVESSGGVPLGGAGLSLLTEEIARFGQLYLQKGQWQGKQLLPAAWVEAATMKQINNSTRDDDALYNDWGQGYGYQFWRCRHGFYRGDGARGQFCIVMPQYEAVVAITADTKEMGTVMALVWDVIVPALKPATLPENPTGAAALQAKLKSLKR